MKNALTQAQVAEILDVPQSFVSKYESAERHLDFVEVFHISQALGIEFKSLARDFSLLMCQKQVVGEKGSKDVRRSRKS